MKKILLFPIFILVSHIGFAQQTTIVYKGTIEIYNSALMKRVEVSYNIQYDIENECFYFFESDTFNPFYFKLSKDQLLLFRRNLEKFLEWWETAIDNLVEIEKEIPDSSISTSIFWKYGSHWYSSNSFVLTFTFRSRSKDYHELILSGNHVAADERKVIDLQIDNIIIKKWEVERLLLGISDESVQKAKDEYQKKKDNEALFN